MKCLVTGTAGFIGSHLSERLIRDGFEVIGIDCFTDYYPRAVKENNLEYLREQRQFSFIEHDIVSFPLDEIITSVDYVFHLSAQAGVRASWGDDFQIYTYNNILGTQKILEACKGKNIKAFIYASSSSIYGDALALPTREDTMPRPVSPYGVSKLAAEHLCYLYWKNYHIPAISLRYFTVYGPRQRPDMAFNRFIKAGLKEDTITIYGDGNQTRDFTFVDDIVEAHILAMKSDHFGEAYNIGGGTRTSVNKVLDILRDLGCAFEIHYQQVQKGDVLHTFADTSKAWKHLGYSPRVSLQEGLKRQVAWQRSMLSGETW